MVFRQCRLTKPFYSTWTNTLTFASDTAVQRIDNDRYDTQIQPGWDILDNANGGYLMAIAARAMADSSRLHPTALSAHFLSPGRVGPATISTQTVKEGRRFSTVRATLAADKPLVELLGSFSDPKSISDAMRIDAEPPDLPPPDDCVRTEPSDTGLPPALMSKVDLRLHPEDARAFEGKPTGAPLMRGWLRLRNDEPIDAFGLLLAADVFPPTIFNANLPVGWVPTLEMTAHIRGLPVPGWLRCRFSTRFITGGVLEEDGEIWDDSGRFVAQSRQLALLPLAAQDQ